MPGTNDIRTRPALAPVSWTLFLALAAYGLALLGVGPSLTSIAATFRVTLAETGLLFTAFFIGFIVGVLGAGYAAERLGKRRVTIAGLAILAAGLWWLGASPGPFASPRFWWALAAMTVMGVGGASVESTASALAADLNPRREGFALNLMQAFFGAGALLAPVIVAVVLRQGWGWQAHFRISGTVTAGLCVALLGQRSAESNVQPLRLTDLIQLLRARALLVLCAAMALYVGSEIGYTGWISSLIQKDIGASVEVAGQGVTSFWVAMTLGRLASTWLVEVIPPRRLMVALAAAGALASGATGLAPSVTWGIVAAGLVGLCYSGAFGLILTAASDRFRQRRAVVFSLVMTSVGVGGMTLPAIMGLVAHAGSLRVAMLAPAVAMAGVALLFLRGPR